MNVIKNNFTSNLPGNIDIFHRFIINAKENIDSADLFPYYARLKNPKTTKRNSH
jgi:hypothetical protein